MAIDFLPEWIYTVLIIPIGLAFQKHFSLKNKVTEIETNQKNYIEKIDKLCSEQTKLAQSVNFMRGELNEYFRAKK